MNKIPLNGKYGEGKVALVSDEDFDYLNQFKWHVHNWGYAARTVHLLKGRKNANKTRTVLMHKEVLTRKGQNENKMGDHINRDKLDNRRENLRWATKTQNMRNSSKQGNNLFKGVDYLPLQKTKPYRAKICVDRKNIYLGIFKTPKEAALAYNEAAIKYHKEFANLNQL